MPPKKTLTPLITNSLLKLPEFILRHLPKIGVGRKTLEIRDFLLQSKQLKKFPRAAKNIRIRKLITQYQRSEDIGSHIPGFYPFLACSSSWKTYPDIQYTAGNAPKDCVYETVTRQQECFTPPNIRLALHIHAYYHDGLEEIIRRVSSNKMTPDIFITGPSHQEDAVKHLMKLYRGNYRYIPSINMGRDILPFLSVIPDIVSSGYDLIGHIHIKKSRPENSEKFIKQWNNYLLTSTVGNVSAGIKTIDDIAIDFSKRDRQPSLYLPHQLDSISWGENRGHAENLFNALGLKKLPEKFIFSVGTMFWAAPDYLEIFTKDCIITASSIAEPVPDDGTPLHAIERLFGAVAIALKRETIIVDAHEVPFALSDRIVSHIGSPEKIAAPNALL